MRRILAPLAKLSVKLSLALSAVLLLASGCARAHDMVSAPGSSGTATPTASSPGSTAGSQSPPTKSPASPAPPSPSSSSQTAPPPVAPVPRVGDCYATSRHGFASHRDGSTPVSCSRSHTTETFAVLAAAAIPTPASVDRAWRLCYARFAAYTGNGPTTSRLGVTVSWPSTPQTDAGQRWARCDVIVTAAFDGRVGLRSDHSVRHALASGPSPQFRGCAGVVPSVRKPIPYTSCLEYHQAELIPAAKSLGGPDAPYPGVRSALATSKTFCARVFAKYVKNTTRYFYFYPTPTSWKSGSHDTACWAFDPNGDGLPPH